VLLIAAVAFHGGLDSHEDHLRLHSTLALQKQIRSRQTPATAPRFERHACANRILRTPGVDAHLEKIFRDFPKHFQLSQPISMSPAVATCRAVAATRNSLPIAAPAAGSSWEDRRGIRTTSNQRSDCRRKAFLACVAELE
jgi:hypothetical protein